MAEEITCIEYDSRDRNGMKKNEVFNVFQDRKIYNLSSPIEVTLVCRDDEFSETAEMRTAIFENIVHINRFRIFNFCKKRNENLAWFNYLLQFMQTDHGGTKYVVEYCNLFVVDHVNHLSLEHAIKLSDALLLNNNDNGKSHIEKFSLLDTFCHVEAFQIIWNSLLETGVPYIELSPQFSENRDGGNNNNNTINFTGLSTNTSVKQLDFGGGCMSQQNWRNLFISIKGNTGLEKIKIKFSSHRSSLHNTETVTCFKEMLRKNITLIDVEASFYVDDDEQNSINDVITIETNFNLKWNQYLMERKEEEEKNDSTISAPPPPLPAHLAAAAERKRRYKMGSLLHAFKNKVVMRDTILFHFLSETPVLLIDDEVQQNLNQVFRNNKKKRPRL